MKVKLSLVIALAAFAANVYADDVVTPKARALTLNDFSDLLATDVGKEYGWTNETEAQVEKIWQDSVAYQWNQAASAEMNGSPPYPYIICHTGDDLSGYKRKNQILNATKTLPRYFRSLSNTDEAYCSLASVHPSKAAEVEGDDFIVQPLMPTMKFLEDTVEAIQLEVKNANSKNNSLYNPVLDVMLCPNVYTENQTEGIDDWKSELTDLVMEKSFPSNLSESYYLISESFINSTEHANIAKRAQFWKSLLDEFQQSDKCEAIYNKRLDYSLQKAYSETDLSVFEIKFNTTGSDDLDTGCFLTLSLAIAALPTVCSLEVRREVKTLNTEAQWIIQSGIENEVPFFDVGLDGEGQVVAVSDTGIDLDNCYFRDVGSTPSEKIDLSARKVVQYIASANEDDYIYGHGTHVAGTVAGKRSDDGITETSGAADGVAPGAKIAFMDIGGTFGGLYLPSYADILNTGRPNAKLHSASWGADINIYTAETAVFDQFMYNNDEFLILVAGGNIGDNNERYTVGTPAAGKNILAVGAHHNAGKSSPNDSPGFEYVAGFSSRGPTADGRMKPDIVAPGDYILSAGALPGKIGECDPNDAYLPEAGDFEEGLLSISGTSMATPATAGAAAIVRQYFEEGFYPSGVKTEADSYKPSGALVKAILMNGAQFMNGVVNSRLGVTAVAPYDESQSFGRLSLKDSLYLRGRTGVQLTVFDREVVLDGGENIYNISIAGSPDCDASNLSVTLVWNDVASRSGCRNCLINDIDLILIQGDKIHYPNGRSFPDRINNAERIIVSANSGDEFEIIVKANNIAQHMQSYAMVATGCFSHENVTSPSTESSETELNVQDGTQSAANVSESGITPKEKTPVDPRQSSSFRPHSTFFITLVKLLVSFLF